MAEQLTEVSPVAEDSESLLDRLGEAGTSRGVEVEHNIVEVGTNRGLGVLCERIILGLLAHLGVDVADGWHLDDSQGVVDLLELFLELSDESLEGLLGRKQLVAVDLLEHLDDSGNAITLGHKVRLERHFRHVVREESGRERNIPPYRRASYQ